MCLVWHQFVSFYQYEIADRVLHSLWHFHVFQEHVLAVQAAKSTIQIPDFQVCVEGAMMSCNDQEQKFVLVLCPVEFCDHLHVRTFLGGTMLKLRETHCVCRVSIQKEL